MYDKVEIRVKAGDGGDGIVSFRREAHVPRGGPDGGDGGKGGDVVVVADPGASDLKAFKKGILYKAERGGNGQGKKMHGKNGLDLLLNVPVGTIVSEQGEPPVLLTDLEEHGQAAVIALGGKGGLGNTHYASSTNQAPRIAQKGEEGAELSVILELRLIADVGIIGLPNAGKSTLLAAATAANPKIADYPFTTLEPMLGVVDVGLDRFVLADIPGLIEGAHLGRGLGHDFLRHIMRTRLLIHLIDGSSPSPVADMEQVDNELRLYDAAMEEKPQIIVINKVDLPEVQDRLEEIQRDFKAAGKSVILVSAAMGSGVAELMAETHRTLKKMIAQEIKRVPPTVFRPQPKELHAKVHKEGDVFIIDSVQLERLVGKADTADPEVRRQLQRQLDRLGIGKALEKAGVSPGDRVRCGDYEWVW